MIHTGQAATVVWMNQVSQLATMRETASPRGMQTKEQVAVTLGVSMRYPVVCCPQRKLGYNFMAAEAFWILSGSNSLDFHPEIREKLGKFSDDGKTNNGSYGPRFIEQVGFVTQTLKMDPDSRQAVMTIWKPNPAPSKDIPCTVALQFLVRHNILHLNVFMRSSDVWLGLPYDIFSFSMMAIFVAIELGVKDLGRMTLLLGSSHLYETDWSNAQDVIRIWDWQSTTPWMAGNFKSVGHLLDILRMIADSPDAKVRLCEGMVHG